MIQAPTKNNLILFGQYKRLNILIFLTILPSLTSSIRFFLYWSEPYETMLGYDIISLLYIVSFFSSHFSLSLSLSQHSEFMACRSLVEVHTSEDLDQILPVENNINDPEYEFLSREPSEFAEETYRIPPSNKLPNSKYSLKPRPSQEHKKLHPSQVATPRSDDIHPTGLVTKLGGTVVKDGVTTIHETSVLGTYISGKYAQVLQSTSHIYNANGVANKQKIAPTHSLRVLKTAAPHIPKKSHIVESTSGVKQAAAVESEEIEEIFGNSQKQNLVRNQRRPAITSNNFKNRFRTTNNRQKEEAEYVDLSSSSSVESITPAVNTPAYKKPRTANKSPKR